MIPRLDRTLALIAALIAPWPVVAQTGTESAPFDAAAEAERTIPLLTAEQLDELLGPIALYPDALIAIILPAATMPTDLVLASRYLGAGGEAAKADEQPWDESVRALARYPEVVKWMDEKLSWVIMVGDAFVAQPVDVMQSIQRLRARARAAGTLVDSNEQKVVEEEGAIRIVPAQPEVIYVPYYDPQVVYVSRPVWPSVYYTPVISYRWCYPTGIWLSYDCDWYRSRVWCVNPHWRHNWYYGRTWYRPHPHKSHTHYSIHRDYGRDWSPKRGGHHDYRRDGRERSGHVVIRDGRREYVRSPGSGNGGSRPDVVRGGDRSRDDRNDASRGAPGDRRAPDVRTTVPDRNRDTAYTDNRNGSRAPGGDRVERGRDPERSRDTPGTRPDRTSRPDRRPENPGTVRQPDAPRSAPPVTVPRNPPVVRNTQPDATPAPAPRPGRWVDRANPSTPTPPRVDTPRSRPEPAAPRVVTAPSNPRPERPTSVRVPVAGGGSRTVVVNPSPSVQPAQPSQPSAPRSEVRGERPHRGGSERGDRGDSGERAAGRRRSSDG